MGVGLLWSWCQAKDSDAEALLCVESDVILRPGVVEAFREAQVLHKGRAGAIAPIFTIPGQNTINSFGGVDERGFMGLSRGDEVGSWRPCQTKIDVLPWAHLACLWIPAATLARDDIAPDPAFRLYFQDQDVSHQITAAGLDIIVVDGAVAEHGGGASTSVLWPNPADIQNAYRSGRAQLREKWGS
jgi:GT2 family glycosyltransferase